MRRTWRGTLRGESSLATPPFESDLVVQTGFFPASATNAVTAKPY